VSSRPELPNPGGKRYWKITADSDDDFILALYSEFDGILSSTIIFKSMATSEEFQCKAHEVLQAFEAKTQYTGNYTYEENKVN
jgi:hypothetical protein